MNIETSEEPTRRKRASSRKVVELVEVQETPYPAQLATHVFATTSARLWEITPAVATWFRSQCLFANQRDIDVENVNRLSSEMTNNRFLSGTPIHVCVFADGVTMRLVNGNHTMEAIKASGRMQILTIIEHRVKTEDEAAIIYSIIDTQKNRTWGDALKATGVKGTSLATQIIQALRRIENDFGTKDDPLLKSRGYVIGRYRDYYAPIGAKLAECFKGGESKVVSHMKKAACLQIALLTMIHNPVKATEFWTQVAHDDMLSKTDPAKALIRYLTANSKTRTRRSNIELTAATASAWNAYMDGRTLEHVQPNNITSLKVRGTGIEFEHPAFARKGKYANEG